VRDDSLEDAFSRREPEAYETAYRLFGARMYSTALRVCGDPAAAQECVHDVLLHLWRRRNAFDKRRGSLEAFLVACTHNSALTHQRNDARRRRILSTLEPSGKYEMEDDPIERDRIARALARLTPQQAHVIQLAYYRGLTLSEIADELQIPLGTIKGRLSSALRALRVALVPGPS
jgi:RNA polymerase sigma-70 factor, ECF subfamily